MNTNLKNITIGILILILAFFIGRWTSPKETKVISVTVPELVGESPIIVNPKPIITTKDSLIYQDSLIFTENPFNKELVDKYIKLESEKDKLLEYLNSIQIRKYQVPFENDTIKIVGNVEVQGELKSIKYDWKVKSQNYNLNIPKPKERIFSVNIGAGLTTTKDLTQLDPSIHLDFIGKKNNVLSLSYSEDKTLGIKYSINLFNINK